MDRQAGLGLDVAAFLHPVVICNPVFGIVADLVFLADVGDPAVEGIERRAVAQEPCLAERAVEIDLDRRTAFVFGRLVGVFDTVVESVRFADQVVFGKGGIQGDRRDVDHDREFGLGAFIGDTERDIEVSRGHELALEVLLLLFRTRFITVDELAAEIQDRTVRPVVGHLERRGDGNHEFVLVLEPDAFAVGVFVAFVIFLRRFDLHAVVAELGIELGFEREEVFREEVAQPENRRQGNGVVTARDRDPRVVV